MAGILVDTNVIIDVADTASHWHAWSARQLERAADTAGVCINPIIYAELAAYVDSMKVLDELLDELVLEKADLPWQAAHAAGRAFVQYRRSGGAKSAPLPDFYIGAHALTAGLTLLTRDIARYRSYFPGIQLIAPDTHP